MYAQGQKHILTYFPRKFNILMNEIFKVHFMPDEM